MKKSIRMYSARSWRAHPTTGPTGSRPSLARSKRCEDQLMRRASLGWTRWAGELSGPHFAEFQTNLTRYNARRLQPALPENASPEDVEREHAVARAEIEFIEAQRRALAPLVESVPSKADAFIDWFEELRNSGPGQGDPLFP